MGRLAQTLDLTSTNLGTPPMNQWHVATAAEAIAAAQFARCGWDVSVQHGANQPEYELIVAKKERILKVSVKGSQDGRWGLTQSYLKDRNYHAAIDTWLQRHNLRTVICFVQFKNATIDELPRVYLATPAQVGAWLKSAAGRRGDTVLKEHHVWGPRAQSAGSTDEIPAAWKFNSDLVHALSSEV